MFNKQISTGLENQTKYQKAMLEACFKTTIGKRLNILYRDSGKIVTGIVSEEENAILRVMTGKIIYRYQPIYNEDSSLRGYELYDRDGEILENSWFVYNENLKILLVKYGLENLAGNLVDVIFLQH